MTHLKISPFLIAAAMTLLAAPAFANPGSSSALLAQAGVNVNIEIGNKSSKRPSKSSKTTRTTRTTHKNSGPNHRGRSDSKTTRTTTTTTTTTTNRTGSSHRRGKPARQNRPQNGNPLTGGHPNNSVVHHEHTVTHHGTAPGERYHPMDDAQFTELLIQIGNEPFSSSKMNVIQMAVDYNYFTSEQTRKVVASLTFSNDQEDAAVMLYPRVVDQDAFYTVMPAFTFESSRSEVQTRLGL